MTSSVKASEGIPVSANAGAPRHSRGLWLTCLTIGLVVTLSVTHGNASLITVTLQGSGGIELTVRDDGVGFTPSSSPSGPHKSGLVGMRDRAQAIGGELYISAAAGGGTEVKVAVPWTG